MDSNKLPVKPDWLTEYDNLKMMIICVFFCCKQSVKK